RARAGQPGGAPPAGRVGQEDRQPLLAAQTGSGRPAVHRLRRARALLRGNRPPSRVHTPLTVAAVPALHVADEPTGRADAWLAAVIDGADLNDVLRAEDGLIPWLWSRWNT